MTGLAKNSWLSLLQSGTAALRPVTPDPIGICFYFATDTSVLSLWNGSAWVTLGSGGLSSITYNPTVAAAGSTVADAAAVLPGYTTVTAADGTKGVVLPTAPVAGTAVYLKNNSASVLKLWPDAAASINAIAANADLPVAAHAAVLMIADTATQWFSLPLLPS